MFSKLLFLIYAFYYGVSQNLPQEFTSEFGDKIPQKVFINIPTAAVWIGKFDKNIRCIEGLHLMVSFYKLKKNSLTVLQYVGGGHFNLMIL